MSHSSSMSTTREVSSHGGMDDRRTPGEPISYGPGGPQNANPFWSERVRDDMALRALRPSFLPPTSDSEELVPVEGASAADALQLSALRMVETDGSMGMNPGVSSFMQGAVPSFESSNYRQDIATVLRVILSQNQELAREVARLRKQVEEGSGVMEGRSGGLTASEGRRQIQEGAHQERFRALEGLTENPKGPGAPGDASFVGALVEVEAVTGGESRPCPPRKTGDPVEQSLAVTSATSSSLGPSAQLQSLVEVEAVTGGESRPCPPRKTAVAVGESLVVPGPRKSTSIPRL